MNKEDHLPKFVQLSRGKLLLYLYNDLTLCKRKLLPNIWNTIAQHKYKQIDQVVKASFLFYCFKIYNLKKKLLLLISRKAKRMLKNYKMSYLNNT